MQLKQQLYILKFISSTNITDFQKLELLKVKYMYMDHLMAFWYLSHIQEVLFSNSRVQLSSRTIDILLDLTVHLLP